MERTVNSAAHSVFTPMQILILTVLFLAALGMVFYEIKNLLMPFFFSFILSYLLSPVVDRLEFIFKKRIYAVSALYLGFFSGLGLFIFFMMPLITREIAKLVINYPFYITKFNALFFDLKLNLEHDYPLLKQFQIFTKIQSQAQIFLVNSAKNLPNILVSVASILSNIALVPFILFCLLLEGPDIQKGLLKLIPNRYFEMTLNLLFRINSQLGSYLSGVLLEAAIVGTMSVIVLLILGVDYAVIIGTVAGFCNLIPYLGPVSGAIPAMIVFYLKMKTIKSIIVVAVLFVAIQFIDNMLVQPIIYSQSINLHPLLVLFSALVGGTFGGLWGLVLAVPIAGILKVIISQLYKDVQFRIQMRFESFSHAQ